VWNQRLEAALAGVEEVPQSRRLNDLHCQQVLKGIIGAKGQFQKLPTHTAQPLPCPDLKSDIAPSWRPIGAAAASVIAAIGSGSNAERAP
jgi:hypothetical protein